MKKEIIVAKANQPIIAKDVNSVESFIMKAVETNLPIESLERLLAMRKEVKAEMSKEAFINAMSSFQAQCPIISKNKDVKGKDGKVRYSYASLDSIVSQVKQALGANGLAYSTQVINEVGFITAVCQITHNLGHSESSSFRIPIGTEEYMTEPQKYASRLTFAKRYAFCNALGILTGEDDFDATDVEKKPEVNSVASVKGKIMFLLKELGADVTVPKESIAKTIKGITGLDLSDNPESLNEIKNRLEVSLQEKLDNQA